VKCISTPFLFVGIDTDCKSGPFSLIYFITKRLGLARTSGPIVSYKSRISWFLTAPPGGATSLPGGATSLPGALP